MFQPQDNIHNQIYQQLFNINLAVQSAGCLEDYVKKAQLHTCLGELSSISAYLNQQGYQGELMERCQSLIGQVQAQLTQLLGTASVLLEDSPMDMGDEEGDRAPSPMNAYQGAFFSAASSFSAPVQRKRERGDEDSAMDVKNLQKKRRVGGAPELGDTPIQCNENQDGAYIEDNIVDGASNSAWDALFATRAEIASTGENPIKTPTEGENSYCRTIGLGFL